MSDKKDPVDWVFTVLWLCSAARPGRTASR